MTKDMLHPFRAFGVAWTGPPASAYALTYKANPTSWLSQLKLNPFVLVKEGEFIVPVEEGKFTVTLSPSPHTHHARKRVKCWVEKASPSTDKV